MQARRVVYWLAVRQIQLAFAHRKHNEQCLRNHSSARVAARDSLMPGVTLGLLTMQRGCKVSALGHGHHMHSGQARLAHCSTEHSSEQSIVQTTAHARQPEGGAALVVTAPPPPTLLLRAYQRVMVHQHGEGAAVVLASQQRACSCYERQWQKMCASSLPKSLASDTVRVLQACRKFC